MRLQSLARGLLSPEVANISAEVGGVPFITVPITPHLCPFYRYATFPSILTSVVQLCACFLMLSSGLIATWLKATYSPPFVET